LDLDAVKIRFSRGIFMVYANDLRVGMIIIYKGDLYRVTNIEHLAPGNWRAMVHAKLKNLNTGTQAENRFRSDDKIEKASLTITEMEYLYYEHEIYHFMDTATYEQISLNKEVLGDNIYYLLPNTRVKIDMYNEKPVDIELPQTVNLKVVETEPPLRGATQTGSFKPAKLETGLVVQVPQFVVVEDIVKVDTLSGKYLERLI
jgi:elongation factor P